MRYTGLALSQEDVDLASAALLYQKWHGYDRFAPEQDHKGRTQKPFESNERANYLNQVKACVQRGCDRAVYGEWHSAYVDACCATGVALERRVPTAGRLVVGMGVNPSLETGLSLHPIHGFPYIPGSSVKGLVHRVAEQELTRDLGMAEATLPAEPPQALVDATLSARVVRCLFGSISSSRGDTPRAMPGANDVLASWRNLCEATRQGREEGCELTDPWRDVLQSLDELLGSNTGGLVRCFDAVPTPSTVENSLTVDVLTPHHSHYYGDPTQRYPDEGQESPKPVPFLAVAPGVVIEFRLGLRKPLTECDTSAPPGSSADESRDEDKGIWSLASQKTLANLERWLHHGLRDHGLGAKTAAGYGYFVTSGNTASAEYPVLEKLEREILDEIDRRIQRQSVTEDDRRFVAALTAARSSAVDTWQEHATKDNRKGRKYRPRIEWLNRVRGSESSSAGSAGAFASLALDTRIVRQRVALVAPALVGGATSSVSDGDVHCTSLRPPAVRGMLRFWARALGGRDRESDLFGGHRFEERETQGQRVTVVSSNALPFGRSVRTEEYRLLREKDVTRADGTSFHRSETIKQMIVPGTEFELAFRIPRDELIQPLQAVLWTWLHLGGIGLRARRGYGAMIRRQQASSGDEFLKDFGVLPLDRPGLVDALTAELLRVFASLSVAPNPRRHHSTETTLDSLDQVFVGQFLPQQYVPKSDKRSSNDLQHTLHGLEWRVRSSDRTRRDEMGRVEGGRLPSPMMWRVFPAKSESGECGHVPVMVWFPRTVAKLDPSDTMLDYLTSELGFDKSLAGHSLTV